MSRPPLASTAATSAPASRPHSTAYYPGRTNDDAHGEDACALLARDLSPASSSASSSAPAPSEAPACAPQLSPVDGSTNHYDDPLLAQRVLHYTSTELPRLLSSTAHRRRDLAALAIESRNPLSRLNALPTLGPLQMIEQYVRRSMFRAGVVSSEAGRLLRSSSVALIDDDAPVSVGQCSDGKLVAFARFRGSSLLRVFDGLLKLQRIVSVPVSNLLSAKDMLVTQRDDIAFVAGGVGHLTHVDGTLLARFCEKEEDDYARSVTQLADGAFATLVRGSSPGVRIYSANLELQHSFVLDNSAHGGAHHVRVTSDDDIVVARDGSVQWYRRDGTLLRQFNWANALNKDVGVRGMAVDAESNIVVSDWRIYSSLQESSVSEPLCRQQGVKCPL